jgi:hypothetical protein
MKTLTLLFALFVVGCATDVVTEKEDSVMRSWSATANMSTGNSVSQPGPQVLFDEEDFGQYVVQFQVIPPVPGPGAAFGLIGEYQATAEIVWKVAGQQVRRVVSVANGVSVQGCCDGVEVHMTDTTVITGSSTAGRAYSITATVSSGTRATTEQPVTLFGGFIPALATGASAAQNIPPNSGVISVDVEATFQNAGAVTQPGPAPVIGIFLNGSGTNVKQFYFPLTGEFVPVPSDAVALQFFNFGPAGSVASVFWLWGIDG